MLTTQEIQVIQQAIPFFTFLVSIAMAIAFWFGGAITQSRGKKGLYIVSLVATIVAIVSIIIFFKIR